MTEECARCGYPIEKTSRFVIIDDEPYCMTCYELITSFREDDMND
ncbi:MAG: hypothetical protein E7Z77_02335 [Methanobrevibacter sp.]|nr:LIM domain-containing protein [Methanobrevibacter sp.]MBE6508232.1 hypothetical protein [Methanobrevibacter sp.]